MRFLDDRLLTVILGVLALSACSPGSNCLTSVECAKGAVCMRIAPAPNDITTQCVLPCGFVDAGPCPSGTSCHCPDSPKGALGIFQANLERKVVPGGQPIGNAHIDVEKP